MSIGWVAFVVVLIIGSVYRYGECKKKGEKGYYYIAIVIWLIGILVYKLMA